jgi:hypothetical protein
MLMDVAANRCAGLLVYRRDDDALRCSGPTHAIPLKPMSEAGLSKEAEVATE